MGKKRRQRQQQKQQLPPPPQTLWEDPASLFPWCSWCGKEDHRWRSCPDGPPADWCGRCEADGHSWAGCPHNPDQEQLQTPSSAATPPLPTSPPSPPSQEIWDWLMHPEADLFHDLPIAINTLWRRDGGRWEKWEAEHHPASFAELALMVVNYLAVDMGDAPFKVELPSREPEREEPLPPREPEVEEPLSREPEGEKLPSREPEGEPSALLDALGAPTVLIERERERENQLTGEKEKKSPQERETERERGNRPRIVYRPGSRQSRTETRAVRLATAGDLSKLPSQRIMGTHVHPKDIPASFFEKKTKVLVIFRNPKDTAVSYFHFYNKNPALPTFDSWDKFFSQYMSGEVMLGSYFDHAVAWEKHIDSDTVKIITYEDMIENLTEGIQQVAKFFSLTLSDEQVQAIAQESTFETMKNKSKETHGQMGNVIFRKGGIGDWKNHFSEEQSKELDAKFEQCLAGTKIGAKLKYEVHCK
ncbi:UNVERIFIED_CONTAM: hypothetical protein FKN15_006124 [Acipenser sinensis]